MLRHPRTAPQGSSCMTMPYRQSTDQRCSWSMTMRHCLQTGQRCNPCTFRHLQHSGQLDIGKPPWQSRCRHSSRRPIPHAGTCSSQIQTPCRRHCPARNQERLLHSDLVLRLRGSLPVFDRPRSRRGCPIRCHRPASTRCCSTLEHRLHQPESLLSGGCRSRSPALRSPRAPAALGAWPATWRVTEKLWRGTCV